MYRKIKIASVTLTVVMIASCATDRIKFAQKENPECKTQETRYDFGKKIPVREIKANNRKYVRNVYRTAWRNSHNGYSALNSIRKDKHPEMDIFRLGATKDFPADANSGIRELRFSETMTKIPGVSLLHYEFKELPVPELIISKSPEVIISPSAGKLLLKNTLSDNESDNSLVLLQMATNNDTSPNTGQSDKTRGTPFHDNMDFVLLMALLAGMIPFAAIRATPRLANNISFWAAMNPWKTRFMFAGAQIALGASGILLGGRLADSGMHFTDLSKDIILGTFLTSAFFYPVRYASVRLLKHSYLKQKAFDLALAISGFLLMVNTGNDPLFRASLINMININGNEQQTLRTPGDFSQAPKHMVLYQQNDSQFQESQPAPMRKEPTRGLKILYTVLAVLGGLGLAWLLAMAACGLSCNGMEGLAYLVGIGGGILLIVLAVLLIKSIWNPRHKRKANPSKVPGSIQTDGTLQI
jgi:hypothetical protein